MRYTYWAVVFLISSLFSLSSHGEMKLGVPNFRPYSYEQNGQIVGLAIAPVENTLKQMQIKYSITQFANYSDLFKALKRGEIDGAFLASQNLERDRIADFSAPVLINNWSWINLKESEFNIPSHHFLRYAKVATVEKTNTYRWLIRKGYRVIGAKAKDLPELLFSKKVDAIFVSQAVFNNHLQQTQYQQESLNYSVEVAQPFGLYVSKDYHHQHPDFLNTFNTFFNK